VQPAQQRRARVGLEAGQPDGCAGQRQAAAGLFDPDAFLVLDNRRGLAPAQLQPDAVLRRLEAFGEDLPRAQGLAGERVGQAPGAVEQLPALAHAEELKRLVRQLHGAGATCRSPGG